MGNIYKSLAEEMKPPVYRCHIQCRIEHEEYNDVGKLIADSLEWYNKHDNIKKLKQLFGENKLPIMTTVKALKFLETVTLVE